MFAESFPYTETDDQAKAILEIDNDLKIKEESYDKIIYKATINNEEIYFVIGKNTSKMYTSKLTTSDIDTDIIITTKEGTIPLDTMIRVKEITDGKTYESIMKLINSTDVDMYDLSLFAKSIDNYITYGINTHWRPFAYFI